MKVIVLGASGIVGQHLRITQPTNVEAEYFRKDQDEFHLGFDLGNFDQLSKLPDMLAAHKPDAIINLAGESRVDVVERDPDSYYTINVLLPEVLAGWCSDNRCHLVQVSSQAVFSGHSAPYHPKSPRAPINIYGGQKLLAEDKLLRFGDWTIARLTFILGIRPFGYGRRNPLEDMIEQPTQRQVMDKWFSPCFAIDAARQLWFLAEDTTRPQKLPFSLKLQRTAHIGLPIRTNRYELATLINSFNGHKNEISAALFADFPNLAPRPTDTTWTNDVLVPVENPIAYLQHGLIDCMFEWRKLHEQPITGATIN